MKKFVKVAGVILGIGAIFSAGMITKAATDWKSNAINSAYSELLDSASSKTNELTKDVTTDVNVKIQSEIAGTVDEQQAELQRLLEQYYQMKLDSLTDTDEFKSLEATIKQIQQNVYDSYRQQIDEAFAAQSGQ